MNWSRRSSLPLLLIPCLVAACSDDVVPVTPQGTYTEVPESADAGSAEAGPFSQFTDVAAEWGVDFVHDNGARGGKYMPETLGGGVAVLDVDGDGLSDLFFPNARPWPGADDGSKPTARLYRNTGAGFEDVTAQWGLDVVRFDVGVTAADYDGDGDTDLFVTGVGPCALWRNDGGRFTDVAREAGVAGEPWIDAEGRTHDAVWSAAAFLDYDGDGTLDLYACRYIRWSMERDVFTTIDGKTKAYTIPDRYAGDSGHLYRGKGDGTFEDVTDAAGLRNNDAKALGVVAADLDGDGDTDLAVANDTQPNHLYVNNGDGTFSEQGLEAGIAYDNTGKARADMGIAAARLEPDGLPVIVTGTFSQEALSFYRSQRAATSLTYIDQGGGAGVAGPTFASLTFGVMFEDLDLDGLQDLVIANGHIEPTIQSVMKDIPYAQRPQVFRNAGGGRFVDVSPGAGPAFSTPCVGRGLAWGDLDGDGDADLVISCNGEAARILRNDAPKGQRSLRLLLEGSGGNRDALGAVVTVTCGSLVMTRERTGGGSYCSSSQREILFGLGVATGADDVKVRWPEGTTLEVGGLEAGRWRIRRDGPPEKLGD